MVSVGGLAVVMLTHLAGFVWWAATLTSRVKHIEVWIEGNTRLAERIGVLETQNITVARDVSDIKKLIGKIFDRMEGRAERDDG